MHLAGWLKGILGVLAGAVLIAAVVIGIWFFLRSRLTNWGATTKEIAQSLPGDAAVGGTVVQQRTKAITIHAPAAQVYAWLVQLGQEKGGFYSYEGFENLIGCDIHNADRIHAEWQAVKPGDLVRMYPKDKGGPPPYIVVSFTPDRAFILGHHLDNDAIGWNDTWQYILTAEDAHTTRLILRDRTRPMGQAWDIMTPGFDIMERAMLMGIRDRAEKGS